MMLIPKWGNYPGDGGGGITLVIDRLGARQVAEFVEHDQIDAGEGVSEPRGVEMAL